jgi:hypothetical protein
LEKGKFNGAIAIIVAIGVVEIEFAVLAPYCNHNDVDVMDFQQLFSCRTKLETQTHSPTLSTFGNILMDARTHGRTDARKKKKILEMQYFIYAIDMRR